MVIIKRGNILLLILSAVFLIVVPMATASDDLFIKRANFLYEDVTSSEGLLLQVKLENLASEDLKDLRISVGIPAEGVVQTFGPFEIEDDMQKLFYVPLDDVDPGFYIARISVYNNDIREVKHRFVNVIN